jgi:hypothetical protein
MKVIGHKRPRKTDRFTVGQDTAKSIQKIIAVLIIEKNLSSINAPHNDMVQRTRGVYAGFARHVHNISNKSKFVNRKSEERPLFPYLLWPMPMKIVIGASTPILLKC